MPRTLIVSSRRSCFDFHSPPHYTGALSKACPGPRTGNFPAIHRGSDAERSRPRKRVFRCRPAALQARLRESGSPDRAAAARILREAHAGTETQEGRGREAPHEARHPRCQRWPRRPSGALLLTRHPVPNEPSFPFTSMSLKDRITEDMKAAMRAKESERLGTIRMITAAIKQREV